VVLVDRTRHVDLRRPEHPWAVAEHLQAVAAGATEDTLRHPLPRHRSRRRAAGCGERTRRGAGWKDDIIFLRKIVPAGRTATTDQGGTAGRVAARRDRRAKEIWAGSSMTSCRAAASRRYGQRYFRRPAARALRPRRAAADNSRRSGAPPCARPRPPPRDRRSTRWRTCVCFVEDA
jgi:hypothetical protein